ncbi:hypothetical protein BCR34DRAFT_601995 [Clohesyomyces aquaticus]|uniref:Uncharacterized protein n=1 Tax=Clohesyomyces aquaticus TaxID=1231657 RepID=A0A1Y1ZL24_9PLEO|nr:hypothetical protein BCR34DRAFT_601995 [Clohesyomyces aquaticus]
MDPLAEPFLLNIPMECRLRIYDYCLEDNCFTIGSADVKNSSDKKSTKSSTAHIGIAGKDSAAKESTPTATDIADIEENSTSGSLTSPIDLTEDDDDEEPMPPPSYTGIVGLPTNHVPVVRSFYHPKLLSLGKPTSITRSEALASGWDFDRKVLYPDPLPLFLTNRQIRDELQDYIRILLKKGTGPHPNNLSVFVSYPYGIIVLEALQPELLERTKNLYISGYYDVEGDSLVRLRDPSYDPQDPESRKKMKAVLQPFKRQPYNPPIMTFNPFSGITRAAANSALGELFEWILPHPDQKLIARRICKEEPKVEMRIFYPDDSYSQVWGDCQRSTVPVVLRKTRGYKVGLTIFMGDRGCVVKFMATKSEVQEENILRCKWERCGGGVEATEKAVIGEHWPLDVNEDGDVGADKVKSK